MIFLEDIVSLLVPALQLVVTLNLLFITWVFYRRLSRKRFFLAKDSARLRFQDVVSEFGGGRRGRDHMVTVLRRGSTRPERAAIAELLLEGIRPENAARFSELLFMLGYVEEWARAAFGQKSCGKLVTQAVRREAWTAAGTRTNPVMRWVRRSNLLTVTRCLAVARLGRLAPEMAAPFLLEALSDPSGRVRRLACFSLGRLRDTRFLDVLLGEVRKACEAKNNVSLQSLKLALVHFRLEDLPAFVPCLRDTHDGVRLATADCVREICTVAARNSVLNKNDFSHDFYHLALSQLAQDPSPEVRARVVGIIRHFHDAAAMRTIGLLTRDECESVRVQAVGACSERSYAALHADVVRCLEDDSSRVRSEAVRALLAMGGAGIQELYRRLVRTDSPEVAGDLIEGLQRYGALPSFLRSLSSGSQEGELAQMAARKMVRTGRTAFLTFALSAVSDAGLVLRLMELRAQAPDPECKAVLAALSRAGNAQVRSRATELLAAVSTGATSG